MTARVSIVMCVHNELALTRACLDSLRATPEPLELVVVDNGSTDDTPAFFARAAYPFPIRYRREERNEAIIARLNAGWRLATADHVCFLHNDTEMVEPAWLGRLLGALAAPGVGLVGLYGAKRLRRDGRLMGRSIVHALAEGPTVRPPWEEVVFVDSVCLCLRRDLLETVGGFDEGYGFYHGHDRDLSLAVRGTGRRCLVVHAPFRHRGGGTRGREFAARPDRERADLDLRTAALERFARKWAHQLPCDVRPAGERIRDWLRSKARG
jgi:O-antigen biosynthesis protein